MAEDRMLSDEILLGIINSKSGGGGGGGTSNYNDLSNKPQIGGVTLSGNKTASDLGLVAAETDKGLSSNDYTDADKAIVGGVTAALAGKQNVLTAGNNIKIDNNTISVNRWAVPAGKVVYTVITSDENYGQNVHVQRHTTGGALIDDRTFLCVSYTTVDVDDLIRIYNPYSSFTITLLKNSDEHQSGYSYTVNPITTPTSNSFTFMMEQEENANDLIIRSELSAVSDAVDAIKDGTNIDSFADVETALALKQDKTDNSLQTTSKTVVGGINELKSGLINYQTQNDLNLEVPNRKNILPVSLANVKAKNTSGTWTGNTYAINSGEITFTANADGYITEIVVNGTFATNTTFFKLCDNFSPFETKNYILSGVVADTEQEVIQIYFHNDTDDIDVNPRDKGQGATISLNKGKSYTCYLRVSTGTLIDNESVYPMLRETGQNSTFAPYIPSVESRIEAVEERKLKWFNIEVPANSTEYDLSSDLPTGAEVVSVLPTGGSGLTVVQYNISQTKLYFASAPSSKAYARVYYY